MEVLFIIFLVVVIFSFGKWWANDEMERKKDVIEEIRRGVRKELERKGMMDKFGELRNRSYYSDPDEINQMIKDYGYFLKEMDLISHAVIPGLIVGRFLGEKDTDTLKQIKKRVLVFREAQRKESMSSE